MEFAGRPGVFCAVARRLNSTEEELDSEVSPPPEGVRLEVVREIPAAESVTHANPQYGAGGGDQVYIPDLPGRMRGGDVIAVGPDGTKVPVTVRHGAKSNGRGDGRRFHRRDELRP